MNRLNRGEIRRLVLAGFTLSYSGGDGKQVVTGGTDAGMAKLLVGGKAKLTALKKAGVRA
jgi:hypothetical protein